MLDTVFSQFTAGGPFMWVLLGVLLVAIAVMIERFIFYSVTCKEDASKLADEIIAKIQQSGIDDARKRAEAGTAPANAVLAAAVSSAQENNSEENIGKGVERAAIKQVPRLGQRLNYLSLFANIATLLGLLGTIAGLQLSFSSLANVEASEKAAMLAAGISQALTTTAFGLTIAVPCMAMFTVFTNIQSEKLQDLDESVSRVIDALLKKN